MSQHLLSLIRRGATAEVAAEVEADPQAVYARDPQGVSMLMWSVYTGQAVIRDFLLGRIAQLDLFEAAAVGDRLRLLFLLKNDPSSIHSSSPDGWSPLHLAAAFCGHETSQLLLEHGADVHLWSQNPQRNQPLHACIAISRSVETARLLIDHGADVNASQVGGYTPLHQAAAAGQKEMVLLLLASGADRTRPCAQGKTPAQYAEERGHSEIAAILNENPAG